MRTFNTISKKNRPRDLEEWVKQNPDIGGDHKEIVETLNGLFYRQFKAPSN